ncbi:hypothetical protein [Candidatus Sarmatiella mevalonica]|uniref:hypothetical protein n=1 Tax=Candidatus Sarmatiella mevalonica TaxID=2770581 RepID=UPI0019207562|nr:hypothetical protein [Candidatus Sarmatiella mevalonica]
MSIITDAGIHQKELALSLPGPAKDKSKTHRIYRLLKSFTIDFISIAKLIIGLFGITSCVLAMDRTNWKFGKTDINILFLAVVINNRSLSKL